MRIAMIAGEANPLAKTGGLGDVVYSLSKELAKKKHQVAIVMPYYSSIKGKKGYRFTKKCSFPVYMSWRKQNADVYYSKIDGVSYYLIANDFYFGRDSLYGYMDDGERFAFFCLAARNLFRELNYAPDVIHTHDWQSAMMNVLIKEQSRDEEIFKYSKLVLTIHNPEFKGFLNADALPDLFGLSESLYDNGTVRFEGMVSTLKAGIMYADKITTVSPNHAKELLTVEMSRGLSSVLELRKYDFVGITNGIDEAEFDPSHDETIPSIYSSLDMSGKAVCRESMLRALALKDTGGPVFGLVSRLTSQKGIDLALSAARGFLKRGGIFLLCGTGEYSLEQMAESLREEFPDQVAIYIGYSNKRAHEIYAASDFFLMPSAFEPCGIGQLIALKYGSLPIVRDTGGLHDTVTHFDGTNLKKANGIMFKDLDMAGIEYGIRLAEEIFADKKVFNQLRVNAMETDNSWTKSAEKYLEVYSR